MLSGRELKRSSSSSLGSAGDVGGVLKGLDWIDDRDGVDEPLSGLDGAGTFISLMDSDDKGRLSVGDIGGVCVVVVWESCWNRFMETTSSSKELEESKLETARLTLSAYGLDAVSKLNMR